MRQTICQQLPYWQMATDALAIEGVSSRIRTARRTLLQSAPNRAVRLTSFILSRFTNNCDFDF